MDQKASEPPPFREVDEPQAPSPTPRLAVPTFPEIFQQHSQFLWRTLLNLGVPSHEAQDLCQEVMLTVHRRLPDFDGRSLRGWLYGICVRTASDYRRSARVRREIPTEPMPDRPFEAQQPEQVDQKRSLSRLQQALERLDESKRAAFVLYEVEELTLAEIAEALSIPLQTAYSRIKTARETLREALEPGGGVKGGVREAG